MTDDPRLEAAAKAWAKVRTLPLPYDQPRYEAALILAVIDAARAFLGEDANRNEVMPDRPAPVAAPADPPSLDTTADDRREARLRELLARTDVGMHRGLVNEFAFLLRRLDEARYPHARND